MGLESYQILGATGRGGAGVVYKALGPDGSTVAIKLLQRSAATELAAFERERRLHETLGEKEGFVPFLESGSSPRGPYLVMPFFAGGTLRSRLERGPLGVEETVALGLALSGAVGRAHRAGIVHRDLKPENVLFGADGEPLVADLGLARYFVREEGGRSSVTITLAGVLKGTAGYMPFEQMNDARNVDARADVFALGAILYECLAGRPAFPGETALESMTRVDQGMFEPLSQARPDAPRWLAAAIERALAREPGARFADARGLRAALEGGGDAAESRRALAVVLGLGAGSVVIGVALALAFPGRRSPPPPASPAPRPEASAPPPAPVPPPRAPVPPPPPLVLTLRYGHEAGEEAVAYGHGFSFTTEGTEPWASRIVAEQRFRSFEIAAKGTRRFEGERCVLDPAEAVIHARSLSGELATTWRRGEPCDPTLAVFTSRIGYRLSELGAFQSEDSNQDAEGEACDLYRHSVTRLPEGAVKEGDSWTAEWKSDRATTGRPLHMLFRQVVTLEKIEERDGRRRASLASSLTGVLEGAPEETCSGETHVSLEVATGRILEHAGSGVLSNHYDVAGERGERIAVTVRVAVGGSAKVRE